MMEKPKVALLILDGLGISSNPLGNAVTKASMPFFKPIWETYPHSQLLAKGLSVGLPPAQMGNSEVGHLNIGAGRVVFQSLTNINMSILTGDFFTNPSLNQAMDKAKENKKSLHLMGLTSFGGVHSSLKHLFALLELAHKKGLEKVYVHCFLDGRDTAMKVAAQDIQEIQSFLKALGIGEIASITGRFYAMDRDKNWERTKKAYNALVLGEGELYDSPIKAINQAYAQGETDEFLKPKIICKQGDPLGLIKEGDSLIMTNFRPDRARQLVQALGLPHFTEFTRPLPPLDLCTLTEYDRHYPFPIAFKQELLNQTLGEVLALHQIPQMRAAETEKYAHVTFFFNAMKEEPYPLEERILTPSLKVASYETNPGMSALALTDNVIKALAQKPCQFLLLNYANPDMVGHSGSFNAVVKALEILDTCLARLVPFLKEQGFDILLTADHGNAEQMIDAYGNPCKTHTFSPVPFIFIPSLSKFKSDWKVATGILADIAPTVLDLLKIPKPQEMTGQSLLRRTL